MLRFLCKSKIHKATVTEANIHYEGSITIDKTLMDAADLIPFERVQIANLRNGVRLETYVIEGPPDSGVIGMNGAAAKLAEKGDQIHIISYCALEHEQALKLQPKIIHLDSKNVLTTFASK
ncbi:MAG: aspartate 1-decarboxylase [Candidatus Omnitrophica bacterium]|nr:aspartate 1-decarboxylase [Candidatus Omnitrophota bacterium]